MGSAVSIMKIDKSAASDLIPNDFNVFFMVVCMHEQLVRKTRRS